MDEIKIFYDWLTINIISSSSGNLIKKLNGLNESFSELCGLQLTAQPFGLDGIGFDPKKKEEEKKFICIWQDFSLLAVIKCNRTQLSDSFLMTMPSFMSWVDVVTDRGLTHHDVLHDRQQHHLFEDIFHQDETWEVFKDQLLEARKLLLVDRKSLAQHVL